ncbi:MAG: hypothetical protein D3916_17625, partial [Candidatus Electrothrix sp. MAN1_4]|nr:hypothetical protein [Candidatus Electrothrix sp. MAN1_4]
MNEYFTAREECPNCGSSNGSELCRTPYNTAPLRDYLISFYSPQGAVEFKYLKDQDYILIECVNCSLINQREIPNGFLMKKIYGEWIAPNKCFNLFEKSRKIDYFSRLSSEIIGIVE